MIEKLPYFLIIIFLSFTNNLVVSTAIFIKKFGLFKKRNPDFVGINGWGIIMDGILAALMNLTAVNWILDIKPKILTEDLIPALLFGFSAMVVSHLYMAVKKWKIWIMPTPWHWNEAGHFHMFSATVQIGFLSYPAILILKNPNLLSLSLTQISFVFFIFLLFLFFLCLQCMKNGIKIGKFTISGKSW